MSAEASLWLVLLAAVWSAAVATKAVRVVRAGERYTFAMWDGGPLRAGKQLGANAAKIKAGLAVVISAVALVTGTGVVPPSAGLSVLILVLFASIANDFIGATTD